MIAIRATSSRQGHSVGSRRVDTAPVGVALRLIVANSSGGHYLLPYPCKQTSELPALGHEPEAVIGNPRTHEARIASTARAPNGSSFRPQFPEKAAPPHFKKRR